ncbi:Putative conjugal transfer protein [Corynebacterium occultum]|uniref:Conjugal transfer protein n=1 Tax=Corynebacterium occultum TaxID=2675219 RepID=A0A6B8W1B9_9CORY|nr:TadA family conjugal transfer-associated ATPase [Corynebacterium occultum]QGU06281.1 Putative conjugal transfer protein [Corynebacterium occultum]
MNRVEELLEKVQRRMVAESIGGDAAETARLVRAEAGAISDVDVLEVLRKLRHDSTGVGKLEQLLMINGVTDIVVNGREQVWFDRGRGMEKSELIFDSEVEVRRLATRLVVACGGRLDDAQPFADGRLHRSDGSQIRVHALLSPPAEGGTCLSLRILRQAVTTLPQLVSGGTLSEEMAQLLRAMVHARQAFLVVGGTGSGKTTLLSALLAEVPEQERILCIEDTAELQPLHPHVVSLVSRGSNIEGSGGISLAELLRQALRMRPDRIVVGEIRGGEVVDLLAALNTGHDGGAGTVHANSLHEVPARMEALAALGGLDAPALHSQLSAAVKVVLVMRRTAVGRQLHQVGVLRGNPVESVVIWDLDNGPSPEFQDFRRQVGL